MKWSKNWYENEIGNYAKGEYLQTIIGGKIKKINKYPKYKIFNGKKYRRGCLPFPHKDSAKFTAKLLRDIGYFARVVEVEKDLWVIYSYNQKSNRIA